MRAKSLPVVLALTLLAGCSGVAGDRAVVDGTGDEEFLNMRAGPGLGYSVVLGLPDGTVVTRKGCVTEFGQLWCEVALAGAPQVTGFVSADYLSSP